MVMKPQVVSVYLNGLNNDGREGLQDYPRSGRPSTSRNADTIKNVHGRWALRMILDELNISKEMIRQVLHEAYRRVRSVQSPSHTISRTSRSSGDSDNVKTSSRLVKTIPVYLIAL
jgi:hypothetical protein